MTDEAQWQKATRALERKCITCNNETNSHNKVGWHTRTAWDGRHLQGAAHSRWCCGMTRATMLSEKWRS